MVHVCAGCACSGAHGEELATLCSKTYQIAKHLSANGSNFPHGRPISCLQLTSVVGQVVELLECQAISLTIEKVVGPYIVME